MSGGLPPMTGADARGVMVMVEPRSATPAGLPPASAGTRSEKPKGSQGPVSNTASVSSTTVDPVASNNTSTKIVLIGK